MAETTVTPSAHRPNYPSRRNTQVPEESRWHRSAACRGTGPAVFFPAGIPKLARADEEQAKACAPHARYGSAAWPSLSSTTRRTESGAASTQTNGGQSLSPPGTWRGS